MESINIDDADEYDKVMASEDESEEEENRNIYTQADERFSGNYYYYTNVRNFIRYNN